MIWRKKAFQKNVKEKKKKLKKKIKRFFDTNADKAELFLSHDVIFTLLQNAFLNHNRLSNDKRALDELGHYTEEISHRTIWDLMSKRLLQDVFSSESNLDILISRKGERRLDWEKILKNKELLRLSAGGVDEFGHNLFHKCAHNCPENLPELIKNYPKKFLKKDLNAKENYMKFSPAMYLFCESGWLEPDVIIPALKAMIDAGYNIKDDGKIIGIAIGHYELELYTNVNQEVITFLLKNCADPSELIGHGDSEANIKLGDDYCVLLNYTLLFSAIIGKYKKLPQILECGVDVNDGISLIKAIENRDWSLVKLLVEHGVDLWKKLGEDFVHSYEKDRDFWINMTAFAFLDKILEDSQKSGDVDPDLLEIILHLLHVGLEKKTVISKSDSGAFASVKNLILKVIQRGMVDDEPTRLLYKVMNKDVDGIKKMVARGGVDVYKKSRLGVSPFQMVQRMYHMSGDKKIFDILMLLVRDSPDQMVERMCRMSKDKKMLDILQLFVGEHKIDLSDYEMEEHETDKEKQTSVAVKNLDTPGVTTNNFEF